MKARKAERAARQAKMLYGLSNSCLAFSPLAVREMESDAKFAGHPQQLARVRAVYKTLAVWPPNHQLQVCFMQPYTQQDVELFIKVIMDTYWSDDFRLGLPPPNWNAPCETADVRISFNKAPGAGSWSMLGKEALTVPKNQATMNLGWTNPTGVFKHEWGHLLGLAHEHQNPKGAGKIEWTDEQTLIEWGKNTQGWSAETTRHNITDALNTDEYNGSEYDPFSIMHYVLDCALFKDCAPTQSFCNCSAQTSRVCAAAGTTEHCGAEHQELSTMDKQTLAQMYPGTTGIGLEPLPVEPVLPVEPEEPIEPIEPEPSCPRVARSGAFVGVTVTAVVLLALFLVFLILWAQQRP